MILQADAKQEADSFGLGQQHKKGNTENTSTGPVVLAIHGGAGGTIPPNMPPEMEAAYRSKLRDSLVRGYQILSAGGTALDAVCAAVVEMEDSELFNAGKGAVFNSSGENECEASVMVAGPSLSNESQGDPLEIGDPSKITSIISHNPHSISHSRRGAAVTLVRQTKNPILLAKALFEHPSEAPHVLMSGETAEELGWKFGCEKVDKNYYWTRRRWLEHRRGLGLPEEESRDTDESQPQDDTRSCQFASSTSPPSYSSLQTPPTSTSGPSSSSPKSDSKIDLDCLPQGTVGAVALDSHGRLACATSTGGKTNKLKGRIGDTPSIGSGFWSEVWNSDQKRMSYEVGDAASNRQDLSEEDHLEDQPFCSRFFSCFKSGSQGDQLEDIEVVKESPRPDSAQAAQAAQAAQPCVSPSTARLEGVAVSGTGDGDYFLRISFASLVAHRMRLRGESASLAGKKVVDELTEVGGRGTGGAIILDLEGKVSFPLNSATMNRGFISSATGAIPRVAIFDHEQCS